MVEFDIIDTFDADINSTYNFKRRTISLGSAPSNDVIISNPIIGDSSLQLIQQGESLIVDLTEAADHTLLNNKRLTGKFLIKAGDVITFGSTTIRIISYTPTVEKNINDILFNKCRTIFEDNKELSQLLTAIDKHAKTPEES